MVAFRNKFKRGCQRRASAMAPVHAAALSQRRRDNAAASAAAIRAYGAHLLAPPFSSTPLLFYFLPHGEALLSILEILQS